MEPSNPLFPVFLKLENLEMLIVGGGNVAHEKLTAVFDNCPAARVRLVATEIFPSVKAYLEQRSVPFAERPFEAADLAGIRIAIIAVNDRLASEAISLECRNLGILTNVADTPDLCDFYLGSVVQKGALKIAISTNGKSPTIAKRVKEVLQEVFPEEINEVLGNMGAIRSRIAGDFTEKVKELNRVTAILSKNPGSSD